MTWILTHSGQRFDLANPDPTAVSPQDIALSLSRLCRFNGHTTRFYSVAQHSLHVAAIVPPQLKLIALLHDAAEAYTGDMVSPLKALIPEYQRVEQAVWLAICARFGLPKTVPLAVHHADRIMLATERRDLLPDHSGVWECLKGITPLAESIPVMTAEHARAMFLNELLEQLVNTHRTKALGGTA